MLKRLTEIKNKPQTFIRCLAYGRPASYGVVLNVENKFEKHKRKFVVTAFSYSEAQNKVPFILSKLSRFEDEQSYADFIDEQEKLHHELSEAQAVVRVQRKANENDKVAASTAQKKILAANWDTKKDIIYNRIFRNQKH